MSLSLFPRFGSFFDDFDAFGSVGPTVHVRENKDTLVLELEVPRYREQDLKVEVHGDHLVISGHRGRENDHYEYNQFLYGEAPMTQFRRSMYIPATWDLSKVSHEVSYGVLQIRIPKSASHPALPPAPQPIPIGGQSANQSPNKPGALAPFTDKGGLQVTSSSSPAEYNAVANVKWPPKIKVDDANDHVTYSTELPPSVDKNHIDMSLDGRNLTLGIHHKRDVSKKDSKGNCVFQQSQSVSYSTNLLVPEGTTAQDISTDYSNGKLNINVSKHANPSQQVPVKPSK